MRKKCFCHHFFKLVSFTYNKTGTSKVGAISKAQKAQNIFVEKNFGKYGTMPKNVKEGTILIYKHAFCCNKKRKGGPFEDIKKISEKVAQCRKKIKKGDPLASAGFVGYVGGTLWRQKHFQKKVAQCRKTKKGTFSLGRFCRLR